MLGKQWRSAAVLLDRQYQPMWADDVSVDSPWQWQQEIVCEHAWGVDDRMVWGINLRPQHVKKSSWTELIWFVRNIHVNKYNQSWDHLWELCHTSGKIAALLFYAKPDVSCFSIVFFFLFKFQEMRGINVSYQQLFTCSNQE